jgi:hypothetical protein
MAGAQENISPKQQKLYEAQSDSTWVAMESAAS